MNHPKYIWPTDVKTHLSKRERKIVEKAAAKVFISIVRREKSPIKRSLLIYRAGEDFLYAMIVGWSAKAKWPAKVMEAH